MNPPLDPGVVGAFGRFNQISVLSFFLSSFFFFVKNTFEQESSEV